jgi:DNA-binding transcriptional regulator of glucitol operon
VRRLLTPRWLALHTVVIVLVVAFLWLGQWQYGRATRGNNLSWAYTFQWPLFALFVLGLWVKMMRDETRGDAKPKAERPPPLRPPPLRPLAPAAKPVDDDPELAAYNRYLAWLAANPDKRPSDYPG